MGQRYSASRAARCRSAVGAADPQSSRFSALHPSVITVSVRGDATTGTPVSARSNGERVLASSSRSAPSGEGDPAYPQAYGPESRTIVNYLDLPCSMSRPRPMTIPQTSSHVPSGVRQRGRAHPATPSSPSVLLEKRRLPVAALPTRTYTFPHHDSTVSKPRPKETCVVCLEEFDAGCSVIRLPCLHQFHAGECGDWTRETNFCPVCKLDLHPSHIHRKLRYRLHEVEDMTVKELRYACYYIGILDSIQNAVEKSDVVRTIAGSRLVTVLCPAEATLAQQPVRELQRYLDILGVDCRSCIDKADLVSTLLKQPFVVEDAQTSLA